MRLLRMLAALGLALGFGCEAEIPDGVYVCETTDECPPGQLCDVAAGVCRREPPCSSPLTCELLRADCGQPEDGCGGTLDCGECEGVDSCGGGGVEFLCGCTPTTCAEAGATCGAIDDGCGGSLDCGGCAPPDECVDGLCGCADPNACDGRECGDVVDACGNVVSCGACEATESCMLGMCIVGSCVPIEDPCGAVDRVCGAAEDGCGETVACGSCTAPETCNGGGVPGQCGCTPTASCAGAGAECGAIPDGCSGMLSCPNTCDDTEMCMGIECVCRPDEFEDNDRPTSAANQGTLLGRDSINEATIDEATDVDHFVWSFVGKEGSGGADVFTITLRQIPVGSDYDLQVFVECSGAIGTTLSCNQGREVANPSGGSGCESTSPGTNWETVSFPSPCGIGTHELRVVVLADDWAETCAPYELELVPPD